MINPIVWKAMVGPLKNVPREGSVVYYYTHIHVVASPTPIIPQLLSARRLACVLGVHHGAQGDDVYARFHLAPIQGEYAKNEGGGIADSIEGGESTVFIRSLTNSFIGSLGSYYVSKNLAQAMFPPVQMLPPNAVDTKFMIVPIVAFDIGGGAIPGLLLKYNFQSSRYDLAGSWSDFRHLRDLKTNDQVVFVRVGDQLTVGTRRRRGTHVILQEMTSAVQTGMKI